jgi:hypothetical protein
MADEKIPYTLESANFLNAMKLAGTNAVAAISAIDNEISQMTANFNAEIKSRLTRKADLMLIVNHTEGVIGMVEADAKNVTAVIEGALKGVLDNVGRDLADFGAMFGVKPAVPQITDKTEPAGTAAATPPEGTGGSAS